jgi:hypothetical protein
MEIALITGFGLLGKAISDSNKAKSIISENIVSSNVFHSERINSARDELKGLARNNRELSKDPERTNVIPLLYPQSYFKRPVGESGTLTEVVSTDASDASLNFGDMFRSNTWKKRAEFVASNDIAADGSKFYQNEISAIEKWSSFGDRTDMTYKVVKKEDMTFENMEHMTSQRDFNVYNDYNEQRSPLAIELFTGSSKNYFPKQEKENFFNPAKDVSFVNGMPAMTGVLQDRYVDAVRLERRNERPFEPRQIGPGIGLSIDQDSLGGFHDTTRVLPKDIDQLRRADLPRESKATPINHGKLGETNPVMTPWKKYLPEKFRQQNGGELVPGSSQISASAVRENFNLLIGNRAISREEMGNAAANVKKFAKNTIGHVKESARNVYKHFENGNARALVPQITQNIKSFTNFENQRSKTNVDYVRPPQVVVARGVNLPQDAANTTIRQTLSQMPTTGVSQSHIRALKAKFVDEAKVTIRQTLGEFTNQNVKNSKGYKVRFADDPKVTMRQMHAESAYERPAEVTNSRTTAYINDDVRATMRQMNVTEEVGRMFSNANQNAVYNLDDLEVTTRQLTDAYDYTQPGGQNIGTVAYKEEELASNLEPTMKDVVKVKDYIGGGGNGTSSVNHSAYDNAHTNITREVLTKGRAPNKEGVKHAASLENTQVALKAYQNIQRQWVPTATRRINKHNIDDDIRMKLVAMKDKAYYDDRLYSSLNAVLLKNPIVNNPIHHPFRQD